MNNHLLFLFQNKQFLILYFHLFFTNLFQFKRIYHMIHKTKGALYCTICMDKSFSLPSCVSIINMPIRALLYNNIPLWSSYLILDLDMCNDL